MNILYIPSDNNPTSGAFLSMVTLVTLLRNNFGVTPFVVLPKDGDGKRLLEENKIPYEIIKSYDWVVPQEIHNKFSCKAKALVKRLLNIQAAKRIATIARREKSELVHINTTYAYIGALAAQYAKLPYIWHLREFVEEDQGRTLWNREYGNKLIASADKVIAISTSVYAKYKDVIPSEKLTVILNGIDCDKFYRPEKCICQCEKFILIYGGGYATRKGIYEFSSALELLLDWGIDNFEVWFIGEPNDKYIQHLRKVGIIAHAKFLGYQKDVAQWYEQADFAFSCSKAEAFGRKTVEAMLAGTLMIAANTGGTLDIIKHKQTGLLYQQGDPIDLAFKIIYAMNHPKECQTIADNGRMYAYQNLGALKNAAEIYEQYSQMLS